MTDPSTIVDITTAILIDSILAADPNAITTFLALDLEMGDARHIRRPDLASKGPRRALSIRVRR